MAAQDSNNYRMKTKPAQIRLIAVVILLFLIGVRTISAQGDSPTTVINKVNQLRVAEDLTALLAQPSLMEIAQQHSQYLASLGTATEIGPDGSVPQERAEAAGFGSGAEIIIFENEACGLDAGIQELLESAWNQPEDQEALLHPNLRYIGAGVSYTGDLVCYTVVTGYWVGNPEPTQLLSPTPGTPSSSSQPTAVPVAISTPLPDGTVKHQIAFGQTLWIIAEVYNIPLEELRQLNGFDPDTVVNPGTEIIIQPSYTPTNTPIGKPSPTLPPRYTHTPSPVGFQGTQVIPGPATPSPVNAVMTQPRFRASAKNPLLVIAAVLISGGTLAAALVVSFRNRE